MFFADLSRFGFIMPDPTDQRLPGVGTGSATDGAGVLVTGNLPKPISFLKVRF